jgi:DNA polymerase III subunit delta
MADDLKPAYLIAGGDRPKVDRAVERLRARFEPDAVELHDAETTGDDAVAACNALGLFGDGSRLVLVEGVDAWKAADAKAIAGYLKAPAPGTTLALVGGELKKDGPLAKAVAGSGEVLVWDVPQRGMQGWVTEQFKLRGAAADADACRLLIELVGDDLYDLAGEVDKLATWAAAGERITQSEVEQLVAPRAESPGFVLTDAWGARDVAGVLRAAERMIERSGDPKSRTIPRIVGSLTNHVGRIRSVQRLDAEGVPSKEAASRLKMHPFYVQKLYAQSRNYSPDELNSVTVRLAQLDHALKGGSRLANDLELERALVEVTQPAAA